MPQQIPPVISTLSVSPASGPGGTIFSASVVTGEVAPLAVSYQWRLDGKDVAGATGPSHVSGPAGALTVLVTATGTDGTDVRESAPVTVVPGIAAPEVFEVGITPAAGAVGDRFSVVAAARGVPVPEMAFQWLLDGVEIPGAAGPSFVASAPGSLSVRAIARNSSGAGSRVSGAVVVGSTQSAPVVLGVTIQPTSGRVGDRFSAIASTTGDPVPALDFQWQLDGDPIQGATGESHAATVAGALSVRVTARNPLGSDSAQSAIVSVLAALVPPAIERLDLVPSAGTVGETFSASAVVTGDPAPEVTYQWALDGVAIPGAVGPSHTPMAAGALSVTATATSPVGSASAVGTATVSVPAIGAPVAAGRLSPQSFVERTGVQSYDVRGDFSVAGDADLATVGWSLVGAGEGVFAAGVFEDGVLVDDENGYARIDSRGVVTIDTDRSGLLDGVSLTVRASNASGSAESAFPLSVTAAGGGDAELLVNGDFSQGSTGWIANSGVTIEDGVARFEGAGILRQLEVPFEAGATYSFEFDVPEVLAGRFRAQLGGANAVYGDWISSAGSYQQNLTATEGHSELRLTSATGSRIVVTSVAVRKLL
jgi:PKD repeat protein